MKTTEERFLDKVELIPFHECWEWVGAQLIIHRKSWTHL